MRKWYTRYWYQAINGLRCVLFRTIPFLMYLQKPSSDLMKVNGNYLGEEVNLDHCLHHRRRMVRNINMYRQSSRYNWRLAGSKMGRQSTLVFFVLLLSKIVQLVHFSALTYFNLLPFLYTPSYSIPRGWFLLIMILLFAKSHTMHNHYPPM